MELIENIKERISESLDHLDLDDRVNAINELRAHIAEFSPFRDQPVDFVKWVANEKVTANEYNPNVVAPPEMELLRLSVEHDGYTMPIVTMDKGEGEHQIIDGYHRSRVGKEYPEIQEKVHSYLPVTTIRSSQRGRNDRVASTIRHNRARGKHRIDAMSEIVVELKKRNWSDDRVARELGMDADEVLRLCQITGLSELFNDDDFSRAWQVAHDVSDDDFVELREEDIK